MSTQPTNVPTATVPTRRKHPSFACDLYYGASKTRKTTNIGIAALYVWRKYGLKTRLLTADTGGYEPIDTLVDEGIIEPFLLVPRAYPLETIDQICQGMWPTDPADPASKLERSKWEGIGLMAIEGLTSIGDLVMRMWSSRGQKLSQDPNFQYKDGETTYSGSNMSYYGEIQNRIYDLVVKSSMLPVKRVIWTALEGTGEDKSSGISNVVLGPAIAGKKATGKCGAWFGNMLHFDLVEEEGKLNPLTKSIDTVQKVVMYLQPHIDPLTKKTWPAGTRAPFMVAGEMPPYMTADVGMLYEKLETLREKARGMISGSQGEAK